jgi:hypothetical protein
MPGNLAVAEDDAALLDAADARDAHPERQILPYGPAADETRASARSYTWTYWRAAASQE